MSNRGGGTTRRVGPALTRKATHTAHHMRAGAERKDADSTADDGLDDALLEAQTIIPEDQLRLTSKELDEDVTRVITANNPGVHSNLCIFNFADKEYKGVPGGADEHVAVHYDTPGRVMHTESEDAAEQRAWERSYRALVDERRRDRMRAAQDEGKELSSTDLDDDLQRNQFNFTERAAQTYTAAIKTRVISTVPPETSVSAGQMTQWQLYDAYIAEYERILFQANLEKAGSKGAGAAAAAAAAAAATVASMTGAVIATSSTAASTVTGATAAAASRKRAEDPMHSAEMSRALKIMERMCNQNAEDEIYTDFKYWEDASDAFRDSLGTCLPLWKFEDARTKRKMVTAVAWNPGYPDMFAVGYGSYDFMKQGSGLVCVYTLKNVGHPEYAFTLDSGVMSLDFHPNHNALLAVGCYDGTVKVYDVRKRENKHVFASDIKSGKHSDPVWEVRWAPDDAAAGASGSAAPAAGDAAGVAASAAGGGASKSSAELSFYSISSDGRVANWIVTKSELKMETVMTLKLVASDKPASDTAGGAPAATPAPAAAAAATAAAASPGAASSGAQAAANANAGTEDEARLTGLAGGCCFAFNPFQDNIFLVGTEEGRIHKCSLDYSGQYLATYDGHSMAVYAVKWNPFHPRVFISCSADWSVKLWDETHFVPIMSFDLGTAVGDVAWAPYSSTVFSAVTDEGKINVYDLHANKHEQLCEQKLVKKAKCTHVVFNARAPILLVGDSQGGVTSLKLSPNLRKITPIPAPVQRKGEAPVAPPTREEIEIRKMDRLLALSDAKITIVTPIPGLEKAKKKAAVGAAEGEDGDGGDGGGDAAASASAAAGDAAGTE